MKKDAVLIPYLRWLCRYVVSVAVCADGSWFSLLFLLKTVTFMLCTDSIMSFMCEVFGYKLELKMLVRNMVVVEHVAG